MLFSRIFKMNPIFQWILTCFILLFPIYLLHCNKISFLTFKFAFALISLIAFVLPIIFRFSLSLQRGVLYFNFLDVANKEDLKNPDRFNISKGRNFYVKNGNLSLGVWHLLPSSLSEEIRRGEENFEEFLSLGYPIFVYLHGNIGTRASDHRLELYRILTDLNFHVVAFDYRSYGDSSYSEPHEKALASDGVAVYKWVYARAQNSPIFLWGHSLGTGFTTNMAATVSRLNLRPKGVILEAPFDNMPSEIRVHPFGTVFRVFPWYDFLFSKPYYTNDEDFSSSKYILEYCAPTLILHAEDDGIIPAKLGKKLFKIGRKYRKTGCGPVEIKTFESRHKYGHKHICRAPDLPQIIRNFVSKYKYKNYDCSN